MTIVIPLVIGALFGAWYSIEHDDSPTRSGQIKDVMMSGITFATVITATYLSVKLLIKEDSH